jgi:hypothetical protein
MRRKIEMSNMLIEKERKKERKNENIKKNSVRHNEEIMWYIPFATTKR